MAKGAKKGGRVRDKWRDKQWIIVNKPSAFGGGALNYIPITDADRATGRIIENTMHDIVKGTPKESEMDPNDLHRTKVYVQIDKISEGNASTIFKGHEYAKEFLRSLIRRGSSMITFADDYTTQDGYKFRVSLVAFSQRRLNSSKKHELRMVADKILSDRIPKTTVDQFISDVTEGSPTKLSQEIMVEAKKISGLRHLGIKKTKLISTPESRAIEEAKVVSVTTEPTVEAPQ